jgi:hypothetical protein
LAKTSFSVLREALDKADEAYMVAKKSYDEAEHPNKKQFSSLLSVKLNRTKEIRGLIAFKHLLG